MEKLELEFYKTKKFILGISLLILLAFAVVYNQVIRFEFARYVVIVKYDINDSDVIFFLSREDFEYTPNSLDDNLITLTDAEQYYLITRRHRERYFSAKSLAAK